MFPSHARARALPDGGICLMRTFFALLLIANAPNQATYAGLSDYYARQTQALATQAFQSWQHASSASAAEFANRGAPHIATRGGTKAIAAAKQELIQQYLAELIPVTTISSKVAHLPKEHPVQVNTEDADKRWTHYYDKAKNGLRPNVEYAWRSNACAKKSGTIRFTQEHINNLQQNFDVLMWYREQLDEQASGNNHLGDRRFKLFLDYFVADVLKNLPDTPEINVATGTVEPPEWVLDERNMREQVIMCYRYLVAKYHIYPEYEEFGPADRELLMSVMKISFLMGAYFEPDWFEEREVNLKDVSKSTQWKKAIADALQILKLKGMEEGMPVGLQSQSPTRYEEPCIIPIPKPAPKQPVPPKPDTQSPGHKIEIIVRPD